MVPNLAVLRAWTPGFEPPPRPCGSGWRCSSAIWPTPLASVDRLETITEQAIFRERLSCGLAGASLVMAQEFRARYTANQNPILVSLSALVGETPVSLDSLPAGQRIRLVATWSSDSAESYPVFDPASQTIVDHREALWLSWFATAGAFDDSLTGRQESDPAVETENGWQSPLAPGVVFLWLVLHDSRGGVDFASYTLAVVP